MLLHSVHRDVPECSGTAYSLDESNAPKFRVTSRNKLTKGKQMNTSLPNSARTVAPANAWPEFNSREDILRTPAWVVQYDPNSAALLREEWDSITDEEFEVEGFPQTPNITRHLDEIRPGDFILFWVSGPGDTAGLYAWGNASGEATEDDYPKRWSDPDGPLVQKPGMEVYVCDVFSEPFVTRSVLQALPEFKDFELFEMPNRPNAFAVTPEQWSIIRDHLVTDTSAF